MSNRKKPMERDANGRFAAGNRGGPGGSRKQSFSHRSVAREAISAEHVEAIMRKATRLALEGNLSAMRLVLERVCGRVAESTKEATPTDLQLPPLESAAGCAQAVDVVIAGITAGTVDRDTAKLLVDAIQVRVRSIEATDLEERLAALEDAANLVGVRRR